MRRNITSTVSQLAHRTISSRLVVTAAIVLLELGQAYAQSGTSQIPTPQVADAYNVYWNRGLIEKAKGHFEEALADFTKAIELMPDYPAAYRIRAAVEIEMGDVNGAIEDEANADYASLGFPVGPEPETVSCPSSKTSDSETAYAAYSGCRLPRTSVGVLNLVGGLRVKLVDGRAFFNIPSHGKESKEKYLEVVTSLELQPGRHVIVFILPKPAVCGAGGIPGDPFKFCKDNARVIYDSIVIAPGKTYTAVATGAAVGEEQLVHFKKSFELGPPDPDARYYANSAIRFETLWWDGPDHATHHVDISEELESSTAYVDTYKGFLEKGDALSALSALENALALFPHDPNRRTIEDLAYKLRTSLIKDHDYTLCLPYCNKPTPVRTAKRENKAPNPIVKEAAAFRAQSCSVAPFSKTTGAKLLLPPINAPASDEAPVDLAQVISRASRYLTEYEANLGDLIGREEYVQNAVWSNPYLTTQTPQTIQPHTKQQRTESDFAIVQAGKEWVGVRDVNCVDGKVVKTKVQDFQGIFDDAGRVTSVDALQKIEQESANYNIGDVVRTTNLPTFALKVLRPGNTERFEFKKAGETNTGGVRTWTVDFQETKSPTIIHDLHKRDEFASGTLWIEPVTGRVLKTELRVGDNAPSEELRSWTVVTFENNPNLGMLLPANMAEHYETDSGQTIDCKADYFDFRRVQVEAQFHSDLPPSPKP